MSDAKKYRAFTGVLYPDSTSYVCSEQLELLQDCFSKWAYILHDKDVDETGNPKKPHYHWVGYREHGVKISTIAKQLNLPENAVERAKFGWKPIVRYLVHLDSPEKAPYTVDLVTSNFDVSVLMVDELGSDEMAKCILGYLSSSGCYSTRQLVSWALDNGCWSELRRSAGLWSAIMLENRDESVRSKEHGFKRENC